MMREKIVRNASARSVRFDVAIDGYEIHLGVTSGPDTACPLSIIDGRDDGAISQDGRVCGTYIHGLFSSDAFRAVYLNSLGFGGTHVNYRESVEQALDTIALRLEDLGMMRVLDCAG
jgi:adenosylcobyric acid synthase